MCPEAKAVGISSSVPCYSRPGVSDEFLHDHGIRNVTAEEADKLCGAFSAGIFIPYTNSKGEEKRADGKAYGRLRRSKPKADEPKYHNPHKPEGSKDSYYNPYYPIPTRNLESSPELTLIEGEFKSLCLAESGKPTVGLPGFWGFQSRDPLGEKILNDELRFLMQEAGVENVYYIGDADTALNFSFCQAVAKLKEYLGSQHLWLPRISFADRGKGIDDIKATLGKEEFEEYLFHLYDKAIPVQTTDPEALCLKLLEAEEASITKIIKDGDSDFKNFVKNRIIKMAASCGNSPAIREQILQVGKRATKISIAALRSETEILAARTASKGDSERVSAYYDYKRQQFILEAKDNERFIPVDRTGALLVLAGRGYSRKALPGLNTSPAEDVLISAIEQNQVKTLERLSGYKRGVYGSVGKKLLVLESPIIPDIEKGDWSDLKAFLENMFDDEEGQLTYVHGWIQNALRSFLSFDPDAWMMSQTVYLVGKANSGKSLFQSFIDYLLGGEASKPLEALLGGEFNADLFDNVHQKLEDEQNPTDYKAKREFASRIKRFTANRDHGLHDKGAKRITVQPLFRMTISINDEPENLKVIPEISASLKDKISILNCRPNEKFKEKKDVKDYIRTLRSQLPAYAYWILNEFEIPKEMINSRMGLEAYRSPQIMDVLEIDSPGMQILQAVQDLFKYSDFLDDDVKRFGWAPRHRMSSAQIQAALKRCEQTSLLDCSHWKTTFFGESLTKLCEEELERNKGVESKCIAIRRGGRTKDGKKTKSGSRYYIIRRIHSIDMELNGDEIEDEEEY